ncbi:MAG: hypothetical protein WD118_09040 [Phycisphaeraceae bacterium]
MALFSKKKLTLGGMAVIASGLWLAAMSEPAHAAPAFIPGLDNRASALEPIRDIQRWRPPIYQKGRSPIYPYVYRGPGPRGWEFYGGFVPYKKGDYGTQALERSLYPDTMAWPPSLDVWPQPDPQPPLKRKRRY